MYTPLSDLRRRCIKIKAYKITHQRGKYWLDPDHHPLFWGAQYQPVGGDEGDTESVPSPRHEAQQ